MFLHYNFFTYFITVFIIILFELFFIYILYRLYLIYTNIYYIILWIVQLSWCIIIIISDCFFIFYLQLFVFIICFFVFVLYQGLYVNKFVKLLKWPGLKIKYTNKSNKENYKIKRSYSPTYLSLKLFSVSRSKRPVCRACEHSSTRHLSRWRSPPEGRSCCSHLHDDKT